MVACGRSIALFIAAAIAEIGGAYLVWIGIKDHRGLAFVALGAMALTGPSPGDGTCVLVEGRAAPPCGSRAPADRSAGPGDVLDVIVTFRTGVNFPAPIRRSTTGCRS